jgi:hypothetical protein
MRSQEFIELCQKLDIEIDKLLFLVEGKNKRLVEFLKLFLSELPDGYPSLIRENQELVDEIHQNNPNTLITNEDVEYLRIYKNIIDAGGHKEMVIQFAKSQGVRDELVEKLIGLLYERES